MNFPTDITELINSGVVLTDSQAAKVEAYIEHHQHFVSNRCYENARAKAAIRTGKPS